MRRPVRSIANILEGWLEMKEQEGKNPVETNRPRSYSQENLASTAHDAIGMEDVGVEDRNAMSQHADLLSDFD